MYGPRKVAWGGSAFDASIGFLDVLDDTKSHHLNFTA
ncbi:hypothetical protein SLEP1_g59197 [Rubroshorea leprosula]|uniref:Uncharacterized protein n=1 Tax=Rubroshorea leprosula TaxID=152421 RepID=A0AAV5MUV0_9ROSI|nr:hypothetical protein SLEP1_g59197 [Rubroshorea leprosula]